jgi:hypothetical protein
MVPAKKPMPPVLAAIAAKVFDAFPPLPVLLPWHDTQLFAQRVLPIEPADGVGVGVGVGVLGVGVGVLGVGVGVLGVGVGVLGDGLGELGVGVGVPGVGVGAGEPGVGVGVPGAGVGVGAPGAGVDAEAVVSTFGSVGPSLHAINKVPVVKASNNELIFLIPLVLKSVEQFEFFIKSPIG